MAVRIWLCAAVVLLLVVSTPTYCNAARTLRGSSERRLISEERYESEMRSSRWSDQQSGDDAADGFTTKYREWVRLQDLTTGDYEHHPAAANPSSPDNPCC